MTKQLYPEVQAEPKWAAGTAVSRRVRGAGLCDWGDWAPRPRIEVAVERPVRIRVQDSIRLQLYRVLWTP